MSEIKKTSVSQTVRFSLYDDDGQRVASLYARINPSKLTVKLFRLKTLKAYRNKGYARKLLTSAINAYKQDFAITASLPPRSNDEIDLNQLEAFYTSVGLHKKEGTKSTLIYKD